jgi:hypothetical protein
MQTNSPSYTHSGKSVKTLQRMQGLVDNENSKLCFDGGVPNKGTSAPAVVRLSPYIDCLWRTCTNLTRYASSCVVVCLPYPISSAANKIKMRNILRLQTTRRFHTVWDICTSAAFYVFLLAVVSMTTVSIVHCLYVASPWHSFLKVTGVKLLKTKKF